jgi:protein pelota
VKLLHRDDQAGEIRLRLETLDDLWTLRNLIHVGDLVKASTVRTAETATDKVREGKAEKRPMTLGVRVEQVEWHDFDDHLRVLGTIEEGPQDHGRHHTIVLRDDPTNPVTICKRGPLQAWLIDMVREAETAAATPQVVLLAIDDSEAQFAVLRTHGLQWLGSLPAGGQGKRFDGAVDAKKRFYTEALKTLKTLRTSPDVPLVVVGPGWWREEFLTHAQSQEPAAVEGALTDGTSQGGRAGIQEALRRGQIERVARAHRVHAEGEWVEAVFAAMGRPEGAVAVGVDEVRAALAAGAAETLLVADSYVRQGDPAGLLMLASKTRCVTHIISSAHEAGARLGHLAGVAALLRYVPA